MFYLYVVLVMWRGFDTRPSPWEARGLASQTPQDPGQCRMNA